MTHIIDAMKRGMHVISVNKGPLALAFPLTDGNSRIQPCSFSI